MRKKDLEICVDLEQFGGNRVYTVEELVTEVIENRRMNFLKNLLPMKVGEVRKGGTVYRLILFVFILYWRVIINVFFILSK